MDKREILRLIEDTGIVVVIRGMEPAKMSRISKALVEGGIKVMEVTMNSPQPLKTIKELKRLTADLDVVIGAGTVLDGETARAAILAGAEFIVSPHLNLEVIKVSRRYGKVVIPGVMTPTEMMTAWEAGADLLKVFPADAVGPGFIKSVLAPLSQVRIIPTGGINLDNAASFIKAGAIALGVGGSLLEKGIIDSDDYQALTAKAQAFCKAVQEARKK